MAAELVEAKVREAALPPRPRGPDGTGRLPTRRDSGGRRCEPRGRRSGAVLSPFYLRDCPAPASGPQPPPDLPGPNRVWPGRGAARPPRGCPHAGSPRLIGGIKHRWCCPRAPRCRWAPRV